MTQLTTASSFLTNFVTSKAQIESFVNQVVSEIESGSQNPLKLKIYLKSIQKAIEEIDKRTSDSVLAEAGKYSEKSFEVFGAKVEIAELGVKYDYANCNHPRWNEITEQIARLNEEKKILEKFMQTVKNPMVICDESTGGEQVEINPAIKTSTTGIKITIK